MQVLTPVVLRNALLAENMQKEITQELRIPDC